MSPVLPAGPPPEPAVSEPAAVNQILAQLPPGPVIRVELPNLQQSAFAFQAGQNGPYRTFFTFSGQSLTLRNGVLTGTRGFSWDLMSSRLDGADRLVTRRGQGQVDRIYRFLDGADDEVDFPVGCVVVPEGSETVTLRSGARVGTSRMRETCQTGPFTFNNFYWVAGGRIVKSIQWSSREIGMIEIEHLRN